MKMSCKTLKLFCLLFIFTAEVFAQQENQLPSGYGNIKLGMTVEEVKAELKKDSQFGYRGDRDVSLLPRQEDVLIETDTLKTAPYSFLEKCWFQFYEGKLYVITINVKTSKMDYFSIFSKLCSKYGEPENFNPEKAQWNDEDVIMSLERPLALKYTDKKVYDKILEENYVDKTIQEQRAQDFLEGL
ncbi:MAG: hypothetical protein SO116_06145 [Treponema sp.]|nr:hypothetical protein [Spirochaetales bacterium]MDY4902437.1 hypothetical protein [Treponema sp.]